MVYGSIRVAVLLYTLWPILAGPFCLATFSICGAHLNLTPSRVSTGTRGGRLAADTAANAGSNSGCVCLFVPTTISHASRGSVPAYLTRAPSLRFQPVQIVRRPRPCAYLLFKHRLPIRAFLPYENETKKQQKRKKGKRKACKDVVSSWPRPPGPCLQSRTFLNQLTVLSFLRIDFQKHHPCHFY